MTIKNRTVALQLSTSSADVYTVPANFKATIDSIVVANKTTSYVDVTVQWYSAANTTNYAIFGAVRLEPNSTVQITEGFYLDAGDKIKGFATVASSIEVTVKASEKYTVSTL